MTSITFRLSNTRVLSNGVAASLVGKNGYQTKMGRIPALVTAHSLVDITGSTSNIQFNVSNLNNLYDDNFATHVLNITTNVYAGLRGSDYVEFPVLKANDVVSSGLVGYNPDTSPYTTRIVSFNASSNTVKVQNQTNSGRDLYQTLPTPPYYVYFNQVLDPTYFANRWVYVEGSKQTYERDYNVSSLTGAYIANLGTIPKAKGFIKVYVDGIEQGLTSFTWNAGEPNVSLTIGSTDKNVRTVVSQYNIPIIEMGDNIACFTGNTYAVAQTSYISASANYNVALTTNSFFKVQLASNLLANLAGVVGVNISPDIIGTINNINVVANTFTLDYNESTYTGAFLLANSNAYTLQAPFDFTRLSLLADRTIVNVPLGTNIVRARNVNQTGRRSPFVTRVLNITNIRIPRVQNIVLTEQLLRDTSQGVIVNIEVSFDHIEDSEVTDYELTYRLDSDTEIGSVNTVKLPAAGVDSNGRIRYTINNIDRGRATAVNNITVEITPLNNDIRGSTATTSQYVIGKTAQPQNIINLAGGQQGENLVFVWQVPTNDDGTVVDIDLNEIEVRRVSGTLDSSQYDTQWLFGTPTAKVATPASQLIISVPEYSTTTYLFKTKDTSGNESNTTVGIVLTTSRPANLDTYKTWSEDTPTGNVASGLPNENRLEYNYPSFANTVNGGLSFTGSKPADNANGSSSGWSVSPTGITDLYAADDAVYTTQVRDAGSIVTGTLIVRANGSSTTTTNWNGQRETVQTGVTEVSGSSSILRDIDFGGIGTVLGFNNVSAATVSYSANNRTLSSGGASGNVYAIWNDGQFAGDTTNANSWALIAGVINANAIALGETYYANGTATGGNTFGNVTLFPNTYKLVNLVQYSDPGGLLTFEGQSGIVETNIEIRTATTNVFYANSNVNTAVFTDGATNSGWKPYVAAEKTFRYFQVRFSVLNNNPSAANFTLDRIEYLIDLKNRTYKKTFTVSTSPTQVTFDNIFFLQTPTITVTALQDGPYTPVIVNRSNSACNVNVYSNGVAVTGILVNLVAEGV